MSNIFSVLSPFIAGCFIAFVMNVLMRPLERGLDKAFKNRESRFANKLERPLAIIICMLVFTGLVCAVVLLVIPAFVENIATFVKNVPTYVHNIESWWDGVVAFGAQYGVTIPTLNIDANDIVASITAYFSKSGDVFINATIDKTAAVLSVFVKALLAIIFSIYILARKERIGELVKAAVYAFLPKRYADRTMKIGKITDDTFTAFISGQFIEACIFGTLCFIGMVIFKFPFAGLISAVIGFTALIPVFGAFIGLGIGAFLILLVSPVKAFWFIVYICILQQLENNLIYPRVVGKSVGLPGLLCLLAVTIGGSGFGIIGMLVSVPVVAILYELFKEYVDVKLKKKGIKNV